MDKYGIKKNTCDYLFNNGRIKHICFDKTGTLTKNSFELKEVMLCTNKVFQNVTSREHLPADDNGLKVIQLLSCCHSLQYKQESLVGDNMDIEIFRFANLSLE